MSWLDNLERDFKYKCGSCGADTICTLNQADPNYRVDHPCGSCGGSASYEGFLPMLLNLRGKVAFEQNGRKAYTITDGRGNVRYVSATKQHYQETGDIKPHYTRAYEEHLVKTGNVDQLQEVKYKDLVAKRKETLDFAKKLRPELTLSAAKKEGKA